MKNKHTDNAQETIRADDEAAKKLGLTHQMIAARMEYFRDEGAKGLEEPARVPPHFEAVCETARGFLSCPFGDVGRIRKTNVTVRNLRLGKEITYSDLNLHLIAAHGFYGDKDSPFRLDPAALAKVLEIGRH